MKNLIVTLLVLIVIGIVINDGGRYFGARIALNKTTDSLAEYASGAGGGIGATRLSKQVEEMAAQDGVQVIQYAATDERVEIRVQRVVPGTIVLQKALALAKSKPADSPLYVTDFSTAVYR